MRLLPILVVSLLLGFQQHVAAQPVGAQPEASAKPAATATHHRMSWQQRFAQANTTHDGHLTLDQAKAGYVSVARHFDQIDTGKKGYVTLDDIANWHKAQRSARHRNPGTADDFRPRPAVHHSIVDPQTAAQPNSEGSGLTGAHDVAPPTRD